MLDVLAAMVMGSILGSLAVVNIFMWAAGGRFTTNRQIVVAYLAFGIGSVFASAVGNADGGPPNFEGAGPHTLGVLLAALIQAGYRNVGNRPA